MEARSKSILAYAALIVLAVAAGVLYLAYEQRGEEGERLGAAHGALTRERDALQAEVQAQRERALALASELKALQQKNSELSAGMEKLAQGLAQTEREASAAAAARAELSRELQTTARTLDEAKARSAELNKSYEGLLKDKSQLAASDAAHRAALERTRKSFEEIQGEIARLTGARGIYTVQAADSLSTIAAFFYRDGSRWPDIFEANAHLIDHPDLIYPEQVLIVPH